MAQYNYPDKSEVTLPDPEQIQQQWTYEFDTTEEADQFVNNLLAELEYGPEALEGDGVQNGPLWDKIVLYTEYVATKIQLVVLRTLYWLTGSRATS